LRLRPHWRWKVPTVMNITIITATITIITMTMTIMSTDLIAAAAMRTCRLQPN
jgi:hypothetical protein